MDRSPAASSDMHRPVQGSRADYDVEVDRKADASLSIVDSASDSELPVGDAQQPDAWRRKVQEAAAVERNEPKPEAPEPKTSEHERLAPPEPPKPACAD